MCQLLMPLSSKTHGGLQLPSITLLYKKLKLSQASILLTSRDPITRHVVQRKVKIEENKKRVHFRPIQFARDVMAADPSVSRSILMRKTKAVVVSEDADIRQEHNMSLPRQGQMMRVTTKPAAEIWSSAVSNLPSETMKIALNSTTDTLPHNSNLALWRRSDGVLSSCKLCGEQQTLIHVLNMCPVALELWRYNQRHDAVLKVISDFVCVHLQKGQMITDLPDAEYHFPNHIAITDLRPDIVIWDNEQKRVVLIELTICFETVVEDAKARKTLKYTNLLEEAQQNGYQSSIITLEVGSRGVLEIKGLDRLKKLIPVNRKEWQCFLVKISQTVIKESHRIWSTRNWADERT